MRQTGRDGGEGRCLSALQPRVHAGVARHDAADEWAAEDDQRGVGAEVSTPANKLTAEILIAVPKRFPNVRIWRQNTGGAVPMNQVKNAIWAITKGEIPEALTFLKRPTRFGVVGGADLSGVQGPTGRRIEIEVKAGNDKQSDEQRAFQAMIEAAGGAYIIARSVDDVIAYLEGR